MSPRQRWKDALDHGDWDALNDMMPGVPAREPALLLETCSAGQTALERACASSRPEALQAALSLCELLDAYGMSSPVEQVQNALNRSLIAASRAKDSPALVEALIDAGAQVDFQDGLQRTALHEAMGHARFESALALVEAGAQANIPDREGRTVFNMISRGGAAMRDVAIALVERAMRSAPSRVDQAMLDQNALDQALIQERSRRQDIARQRGMDRLGSQAISAGAKQDAAIEAAKQTQELFGRLRSKLDERKDPKDDSNKGPRLGM